MFNHVDQDQFDTLAQRYRLLVGSDFKGVDPLIKETVEKIWGTPGLVPVWSCSGHTGEEQLAKKKEAKVVSRGQERKIYFASLEGQNEPFENFHWWAEKITYDTFHRFKPTLSAIRLHWGFNPDGTSNPELKGNGLTYALWKLSFSFTLTPDWQLPPNLNTVWDGMIEAMITGEV